MREVPCRLLPALPDQLQADHLPVLPGWWPPRTPAATEDNPHPEPLSDRQRADARQARQVTEACTGPYDGQRGRVVCTQAGPPQLLYVADGFFAYRLQPAESNREQACYRYSPADSLSHGKAMAAVAQAFTEMGPAYIEAARTDQPQHSNLAQEATP